MQNTSTVTMLARIEALCEPLPASLLASGKHAHLFYTRSRQLYERDPTSDAVTLLKPKPASLGAHLGPAASPGCVAFLQTLLQPSPARRPTAAEALEHPWLAGGPL
jgi:serine/threonine protein kinase